MTLDMGRVGFNSEPGFPWSPIAFLLAMALMAAYTFSGCATAPRNRECRSGIVGLTSEVVGWAGPESAVGQPKMVVVTAHNCSNQPVRFVMACAQIGRPADRYEVRLDSYRDRDYYFTMRFNPGDTVTEFACNIIEFGEYHLVILKSSTTISRRAR